MAAGAVALAAAVAALAALLAAPATGRPAPLTPDLVTLGIGNESLRVTVEKRGPMLRLANEIANRAAGPLEVFPDPAPSDCDGDGDPANDRVSWQRVFADSDASGAYEPGIDAVEAEHRFGCMRYHPAHDHWHVLDIARYELRRETDGRLVARSRKIGFCLTDTRLVFGEALGPVTPTYPLGSADPSGCDAEATQGISAGWADLYALELPGQQLRVGGLRRGRYCLTSRADPGDLLDELDETNNVRRVRLELRPRKLTVRKRAGGCRIKRG